MFAAASSGVLIITVSINCRVIGYITEIVSHCTLYLFVTDFGCIHGTIKSKEPSTYAVRIMIIIEDGQSIGL